MKAQLGIVLMGFVVVGMGCSSVPKSAESREVLSAQVREAITVMKKKDPGIEAFFKDAYGYAVLPRVAKGAWIIGGAGGKGQVFAEGKLTGYCSMSQATLGFSFGGQYFREVIFFREKRDLARFSSGAYTFSAQVSGVALTLGAAAKADYKDGMAVFVMADKGLMVDASLGGQKFKFTPAKFVD